MVWWWRWCDGDDDDDDDDGDDGDNDVDVVMVMNTKLGRGNVERLSNPALHEVAAVVDERWQAARFIWNTICED